MATQSYDGITHQSFFSAALFGFCMTMFVISGVGWAGTVELTVHATGAASVDVQTRRDLDDSHSCGLLGLAGNEQRLVLAFNKTPGDSLLKPTDFGFSLSIPGMVGRLWNETQPSTVLQLSIGGQRFIGLHAIDPDFRLRVSVDLGGERGTFSASHLLESTTGMVVDVAGAWHCVPDQVIAGIDTDTPRNGEGVSSVAVIPTGASTPESVGSPQADASAEPAKPRHFRLYHRALCRGSWCEAWTARDMSSGETFDASVEFVQLKLADRFIAPLRAGLMELWVTGPARRDARGRLLISAQRLDGIVPRRSGSTPEKALSRR